MPLARMDDTFGKVA